jgi:hypothetical protein
MRTQSEFEYAAAAFVVSVTDAVARHAILTLPRSSGVVATCDRDGFPLGYARSKVPWITARAMALLKRVNPRYAGVASSARSSLSTLTACTAT